ncbi:MAG: DUF3536 domain-containing protein [Gemmatimonadaceae bacterium]|nr:DUF3536 domain-containing protein [Gemmatimonadaceae bacterium]
MTAPHSLIVHQHLYQPPREDPWLEEVRVEPSARPDHDWNARIDRECYARQAAAPFYIREAQARANDADARSGLARVVNLYGWCNFDVGATLCEWLSANAPGTLAAMRAGDAASVRRWGYGNAMAAPYHHVILPLASPRDRLTEIRWGLRDFARRFGRSADGMWLPECAVDEDTLEDLITEGVRYTILAPYQVRGHDGRGMPVRWTSRRHTDRFITIVPYDGALAGDVAFGGLLDNPVALAERFTPWRDQLLEQPTCTTLATDGETFGHHHANGVQALGTALRLIANAPSTRTATQLTNAATLVANHPAEQEVTLVSPSAWSCAHGVERWRSNCGCRLDGGRSPQQEWRAPLREAMTLLGETIQQQYAAEAATLFADDPWSVRDAYGEVVGEDGEQLEQFVRAVIRPDLAHHDEAVQRARVLLEAQRASLRTFTSCAWFFDDVDRIEVRQNLRYTARAMELLAVSDVTREKFQALLSQAVSRSAQHASGRVSAADVLAHDVPPAHDPFLSGAAAAMALVDAGLPAHRVAVFDARTWRQDGQWHASLTHRRTGQHAHFVGEVTGRAAATRVTLQRREPGSVPSVLSAQDMPESAARLLLRAQTTHDDALLG